MEIFVFSQHKTVGFRNVCKPVDHHNYQSRFDQFQTKHLFQVKIYEYDKLLCTTLIVSFTLTNQNKTFVVFLTKQNCFDKVYWLVHHELGNTNSHKCALYII